MNYLPKLKVVAASLAFATLISACKKDTEEIDTSLVNIPDAAFKKVLVEDTNINTDGDAEISMAEAAAFTGGIVANSRNIASVKGLEHFPNITRLTLFNNNITSIDLSKNTKLVQLLLENNQLTSLDVSALSVLTDLKCHTNKLESANIANGNNSNMTRVEFQGNPDLTCIQVDALSAVRASWGKDGSASYSTNCN